jgi:hypothetical protein
MRRYGDMSLAFEPFEDPQLASGHITRENGYACDTREFTNTMYELQGG